MPMYNVIISALGATNTFQIKAKSANHARQQVYDMPEFINVRSEVQDIQPADGARVSPGRGKRRYAKRRLKKRREAEKKQKEQEESL